jgi:hypothetical protein
MSRSDIIAPILSYDDINKRVEDFLREHERDEILPVDIEVIAEFDLGLKILNILFLIPHFLPRRRPSASPRGELIKAGLPRRSL